MDHAGFFLTRSGMRVSRAEERSVRFKRVPIPQHTLKTLGSKHRSFGRSPIFYLTKCGIFFLAEKLGLSRDGHLSKILSLMRVGYPQPNHTPWASQPAWAWSFGQRQDTSTRGLPQIRHGRLYSWLCGLKVLGIRQFRMVER